MTNILEAVSHHFFNGSVDPLSDSNEDNTQYGSPKFWGACLLTIAAGVCLAGTCWKRRECRQLSYQDCLKDPRLLSKLEKATNGTAKVYLGQDFVIKKCTNVTPRYQGTEYAEEAVKKHTYSHLKVPKIKALHVTKQSGAIYEGFSVEQRLPICQSTAESQTIYTTHQEAFTPAVKEFTDLLMRYKFDDLLADRMGPCQYINPLPRYDNVCPYLENGIGKLGLVDLEHFEETTFWFSPNNGTIKYCNKDTCKVLIHLFPLHLKEIINHMEENGLQLAPGEQLELESARNEQLKQRETGICNVRTL